jgi:hypothetical protein
VNYFRCLVVGLFLLVSGSQLNAQSSDFSVGVMTVLQNFHSNNSLSQLDNPTGFGFMIKYKAHGNLAIEISGMRAHDSLRNGTGTETNVHGRTAVLYYPTNMNTVRPYLSGGFGYLSTNTDLNDGVKKNGTNYYSSYGFGTDIGVLKAVNFNIDFSFYNDGMGFVGYGSSIGIHINL